MSLKGFSASYKAVERVVGGENVNKNSQELVTPFPGSLKTIYSNKLSNSDDNDEEQVSAAGKKQYETYKEFQQNNRKKKQ